MLTFDELRVRLDARQDALWQANAQPFFQLGTGEVSHRFGLRVVAADRAALQTADEVADFRAPPPPRIDWRQAGVTSVRDQGGCGACVAFATCAAMESALLLATGEAVDLSEAHLFFCNGGDCDNGWEFIQALEAARTKGVGLEAGFPYSGQSAACIDIAPHLRLANWRRALSRRDRQLALAQAPVIGGLQVFEDFAYYREGIYRHVDGQLEGHHAILVVGYDNDEQYWICKNSWGEGFGEAGYFRIAFGECELDDANPFFAVDLAKP